MGNLRGQGFNEFCSPPAPLSPTPMAEKICNWLNLPGSAGSVKPTSACSPVAAYADCPAPLQYTNGELLLSLFNV